MKNIISYIYLFLIFQIVQAQDYTLDDCIKIAIEGKKTVLSAALNVKSASFGLKASYSSLLPSIQGLAGAGRTIFPEQENINLNFEDITYDIEGITYDTIRTNKFDNYSAGISLNQKLYDGGRSLNKVKQARITFDIAQLNQRLITTQVIQKVTVSYYSLLQAQKLLDVSERNLDMSMQQVALVKKQFDLGVVKRNDLLKAEVAQGQARVDMLNKKTNLQNARRVLFNDMGLQDFGQKINVVEDNWIASKIPSSGEILQLLKEQNPNILVSKSQVELSNISHQLIKGLRLPSLSTSLNYSANSQSSNELIKALSDDWSMGVNLSLTLPLYFGNSLSSQQQQATLSNQQAEYSYTTLLNDFRVQAELIREALINYADIIPLNQSIVLSAEEDLKLVRERYSLGSATILELLDAQVSLIRSKSNLINVVHDARIQEANLNAILGTLDLQYKPKEK